MADPTPPIPPRFRWLLRCLVAGAVLLALLLGLRAYWGHRWHSRFEAELQAIRDRGEPIDVADFNPPLPPDADNAAVFLRQAMRDWPAVPGSSQQITDTDWYTDPEQHPDPITDNAAYLVNCAPALALIERAAKAPSSHWGQVNASPMITNYGLQSHLGELRGLARNMEDAAERAVDTAQPALALQITQQMFVLSESLLNPPVSLLDQLVAISIRAMAMGVLEEQLPKLDANADATELSHELHRLLDVMADETTIRAGYRHAMQFERMFNQDTVAAVAEGRLPMGAMTWGSGGMAWEDTAMRWLIKPLHYRDGCTMMDYLTQYADAAVSPRSDAIERIDESFAYLGDERWMHPLAGILLPAFGAAQRTHLQHLTQQRLARTAVALKRYELDHGQAAATLDDLVPEYLDAIPIDPMDPASGPIRYRPQGGPVLILSYHWMTDEQVVAIENRKLPLLYSVGRDGKDDGGLMGVDDDGTPNDYSRYRGEDDNDPTDHWFLLAPRPEPIPDPNPPTGYPG